MFLKESVQKYYSINGHSSVEWSKIAMNLHRTEEDCIQRWKEISTVVTSRKGVYQVEEDALILVRVKEHFDKGEKRVTGEAWRQIGLELGRPARFVKQRWKTALNRTILGPNGELKNG